MLWVINFLQAGNYMSQARVIILNKTFKKFPENWTLYFQYCIYKYADGSDQRGYRFIWERPDGTLQAARGQARIPSLAVMLELASKALEEGWGGNFDEDDVCTGDILKT